VDVPDPLPLAALGDWGTVAAGRGDRASVARYAAGRTAPPVRSIVAIVSVAGARSNEVAVARSRCSALSAVSAVRSSARPHALARSAVAITA
jgi:hypothetical protein